MTDDTQKVTFRLIGAIAILVLVVLVWWLFLDHDVKRYQETKQSIPVPLKVERFDVKAAQEPAPLPEPVQSQAVAEAAPVVDEKPVVKEKPVADKTPASAPVVAKAAPTAKKTQVSLDNNGIAKAWVVQAASFSQEKNAREFEAKLLKANYPAYIKRLHLDKGTFFRVYIGPKLSLQEAHDMAQKVESQFKIKGQIYQYQAGFEEHQ